MAPSMVITSGRDRVSQSSRSATRWYVSSPSLQDGETVKLGELWICWTCCFWSLPKVFSPFISWLYFPTIMIIYMKWSRGFKVWIATRSYFWELLTAWFLEVSEAQILVAFCLATRHLERDIMKWDWLQNPGRFGVKFEAVRQQKSRFNVVSIRRFNDNLVPACFFHESGWLNYEIFFSATVCWTRFVISFCLRSRCYGYKTTQKNYLFPTKESLKHHKIQVLVQLCCIGIVLANHLVLHAFGHVM